VQTSFGRTFAGDAFIADPLELLFKDFVPGQVYRASLQLINRGFTKNSIRLLEVPAEVKGQGLASALQGDCLHGMAGAVTACLPLLCTSSASKVMLHNGTGSPFIIMTCEVYTAAQTS
jgi:hypothetical protein